MPKGKKKFVLKEAMHELRQEFGGCCKRCGSKTKLEFAHLEPTGINGRGRGGPNRYYNIKKFRHCFILLCRACHLKLDGGWLEYNRETEEFKDVEVESAGF